MKYAKETYADQYTVDSFDGEMSNETINNLIDTCVVNGYDIIVFEQNDPNTPVANVKAAVAAGTKVVVTVGSINDDGESTIWTPTPYSRARCSPRTPSSRALSRQARMLRSCAALTAPSTLMAAMKATSMDLEAVGAKIVDDQTANWSTSEALPIVEAWLISNPEIECIFAANDDMALGAIQAIKSAGRTDIKVFSVDANELGCQALIDGDLTATVAQDTFGYAHGAADYCATLLKGEMAESMRLDSKLVLLADVDQILLTVHGYTQEQVTALYAK